MYEDIVNIELLKLKNFTKWKFMVIKNIIQIVDHPVSLHLLSKC